MKSKQKAILKNRRGRRSDGYVAYPLGLKGVVVSEGDSYEEVLSNIKSAIKFHIETFEEEEPPLIFAVRQ